MRLLGILALVIVASACTGGGGQSCSVVQCNTPGCCGSGCSTDADCCAETVCSTSGRCIPESCVGCGELGCLVDVAACEASCAPSERCGVACTSDGDCGADGRCEAFPSGARHCVPDWFDTQCGLCGADGCTFSTTSCEVSCNEPSASDAGVPSDAGTPAAQSCTACCEPCQTDADCCAGAYCGESAMGGLFCFPTECRTCTYGCTFTCPG